MKIPNRLVRASAGTGKTQALSEQVLRILAAGVPPGEILAVTFTRKAAGEILERVLLLLSQGETADPERLAAVAAVLDRFAVSTVDAFLYRLASVFRHELGLPTTFAVVDGKSPRMAEVRSEAIRALVAREGTEAVLDLAAQLREGKTSGSVGPKLDEIVSSLQEIYREAPPAAWEALPDGASEEVEARLRTLGARFALLRDAQKKKALPKVLGKIADLAAEGEAREILKETLIRNVRSGENAYSRSPLPSEVIEAARELTRAAVEAVRGRLGRRARAIRHLLERYEAAYGEARARGRTYAFGDIPHLLSPTALDPAVAAARLDAKVLHLLLDEFQDTSRVQWKILSPWARRAKSFFCVGDPKQAIYGWRGGCAGLLDTAAAEVGIKDAERTTRNKSYRSSQVVLDAVDRVFSTVAAKLADTPFARAAERWARGYADHEAFHEDRPGCVEWIETEKEALLAAAADRAAEIHRMAPTASVGILLRTNEEAVEILRLLRDAGVAASGEGGRPLGETPAVARIVAALVLAAHPGDTAAAYRVGNSPLALLTGLDLVPTARAASARIRAALLDRGFGDVAAEWAAALAPSCDPLGAERLARLVALADRFDREGDGRPDRFAEILGRTRVGDPSSSIVRVMTIHAAKGLQFDAVVLPVFDEPLGAVGRVRLHVLRSETTGEIEAVLPASNKDIAPFDSLIASARGDEIERRVEDDLSALYVAMTRAKYSLTIATAVDPTDAPTPASILRSARPSTNPEGDANWHLHPKFEGSARASSDPVAESPPLGLSPPTGRRSLRLATPSRAHAKEADVSRLLRPSGPARARGVRIHAALERVGWIEDESEPLDPILSEVLARPGVRAALARPEGLAPDETAELWRERSFAVLDGDRLRVGRWDRVVVVRREGRPVRAALIDFKSVPGIGSAEVHRPQVEAYVEALRVLLGLGCGEVTARILFTETGDSVTL